MAGLWGGETIKGLALPALGGAEHASLRPYNSAPLEPHKTFSLLDQSTFLPTCPKSCQVQLSTGSLPELTTSQIFFSHYLHPFGDPL